MLNGESMLKYIRRNSWDNRDILMRRKMVRRSLIISFFAFIIGLLAAALAITLIASDSVSSDAGKMLLAFSTISAIALIIGSGFAAISTVWSALGYQHLQVIKAQNETIESANELLGVAGWAQQMVVELPALCTTKCMEIISRDDISQEEEEEMLEAFSFVVYEQFDKLEGYSQATSDEVKTRIPAYAGD